MRYFIFFILLYSSLSATSQSRNDLESKKKSLASEIKYTNQLLEKTSSHRKEEYKKLLLINSNIKSRNNLINSIEDEISYLNSQIEINQDILISLNTDLVAYKQEYEDMIYAAYKLQNDYDIVIYILASESFNRAFNRLRYLKEYTKARRKLFEEIELTKNSINDKLVELDILKSEKQNLFVEKKLEYKKLESEKEQHKVLVETLKGKEEQLKNQLRDKEKIARQIQKEIERLIAAEAKKVSNGKLIMVLTPEEKELADIFEQNKNKLPWPIERGIVTSYFGEQPHPVLKGVVIRNDGIDIMTSSNAAVRAVYKGTVSRIFAIPGANRTVIIRHGNYLSVYSNLKDVIVKQGDTVETKQIIGVANTDTSSEDRTVIQFQIWKESVKMDPLTWLAKL